MIIYVKKGVVIKYFNMSKIKNTENKNNKNIKKTTLKKAKNKSGRPSYYESIIEPNLELIGKWKERGYTNEEIAQKLGIGRTTLYENAQRHPELANVLKKSREILIINLEDTLYRMALGFVTKSKTTTVKNKDGEIISETTVTEQLEPSITALIFALKNLDYNRWRDKWEIEASIGKTPVKSFAEYVKEEAEKQIKKDKQNEKAK